MFSLILYLVTQQWSINDVSKLAKMTINMLFAYLTNIGQVARYNFQAVFMFLKVRSFVQ